MKRFECLQAIAPLIKDELFVTTAGGATNEWNAVARATAISRSKPSALLFHRLGLALALPKRKVFVFDGDGALWMNLGSLATIGLHQPKNFIHICWDNKQYESSGGEPTVATAGNINFAGIARQRRHQKLAHGEFSRRTERRGPATLSNTPVRISSPPTSKPVAPSRRRSSTTNWKTNTASSDTSKTPKA